MKVAEGSSVLTCERCGKRPALRQRCPGDGAQHGHGRVHVQGGGLQAVCDACVGEVAEEWRLAGGRAKRRRRAALRALIDAGVVYEPDGFHEGEAVTAPGYTPGAWLMVQESSRGFGQWWATFTTLADLLRYVEQDDADDYELRHVFDLDRRREVQVTVRVVAELDDDEPTPFEVPDEDDDDARP